MDRGPAFCYFAALEPEGPKLPGPKFFVTSLCSLAAAPFAGSEGAGRQRPTGEITLVQIFVRDNNVDQALKALKKKMQREGSFREMKRHVHYEKPSEKRARQ